MSWVVDLGEADILKRQMTQPLDGFVDVHTSIADVFQ